MKVKYLQESLRKDKEGEIAKAFYFLKVSHNCLVIQSSNKFCLSLTIPLWLFEVLQRSNSTVNKKYERGLPNISFDSTF